MAISLVNGGTNGNASSTSIALPSGVASGNLIVIAISCISVSVSPTLPSGFTSLGTHSSGSGGNKMCSTLGYKVAGAGETGPYTWTASSGSTWNSWCIIVLSGQDATTPIDASEGAGGTSSPVSAAALTASVANDLLILCYNDENDVAVSAWPSGVTTYTPCSDSTTSGWATGTKALTASGTTGTLSTSFTAAPATVDGFVFLVKPASGGGSIVSGSATVQANAALVESAAQVVEPSGTIPTPANAALALSGAQVVEPSGTVPVQANAALSETAQIRASATLQANAVLAATGGLVGGGSTVQGGGSIVANAALVETAARIQANAAPQQANAALAVTGRVVTPSVALAASSVLALTSAQVRAAPTIQSNAALSLSNALLLVSVALQANAVLVASGHIPPPPNYKSPTGSTASSSAPTGSTAPSRLSGSTVAVPGLSGVTTVVHPSGTSAHTSALTATTVKE